MSEFVEELAARFEAQGADEETAAEVAELAGTFREDYEDAGLTVELFAERVTEAPYDEFERRWNWTVGDVASGIEDCTDTRDYRLAGFGEVGSTGTW